MIICPKCRHDNDIGRIFCVKCGDKLDISKVRAPSSARLRVKTEHARKFQQTINRASKKLIKVVILAATTAFLTMLFLPPSVDLKDFDASHLSSYEDKRAQLDDAGTSEQKIKIVFTDQEINAAIAQAISNTAKNVDPNAIKLENISFTFKQNAVLITVQNKWRWFRLVLQERSLPIQENGAWTFHPSSFWIGRIHVPPMLNHYMDDLYFSRMWNGFVTEKGVLEKLSSLEIRPGEAILLTSGGS